ncbi:hypothetical protein WSS_A40780 [Rhodococcus opacus M213]|uniref:Uncharacterized protein n=1 Tax=Rhodococcus opacus M213 TaxID=1129896 RepID=K8XI85_RHOOP|nr:hypothetical protein WSS_A40780 [Rhodococcus opacus M213]
MADGRDLHPIGSTYPAITFHRLSVRRNQTTWPTERVVDNVADAECLALRG